MAVGPEPVRRLRDAHQHAGLRNGEVADLQPEIVVGGALEPNDLAAERQMAEIGLENLVLGVQTLHPPRPCRLHELAGPPPAALRVGQTRHLHRDGRSARQHARGTEVLEKRPRHGAVIHPAMRIEARVLHVQRERAHLLGDLVKREREAPFAVVRALVPDRLAVPVAPDAHGRMAGKLGQRILHAPRRDKPDRHGGHRQRKRRHQAKKNLPFHAPIISLKAWGNFLRENFLKRSRFSDLYASGDSPSSDAILDKSPSFPPKN